MAAKPYHWQEKVRNDHPRGDMMNFITKHTAKQEKCFLFSPTEELSGWSGIVHGGLQILLSSQLAETVWQCGEGMSDRGGRRVLTRFHSPVHIGRTYPVRLTTIHCERQWHNLICSIHDTQGKELTRTEFTDRFSSSEDNTAVEQLQTQGLEELSMSTQVQSWPTWRACCSNPIKELIQVDVDWRLGPHQALLAGLFIWPEAEDICSPAALALALMDQGMGYCGHMDGSVVLLTIRLEIAMRRAPQKKAPAILVCRGRRRSAKVFEAQATLSQGRAQLAHGTGLFRTFYN